jgi:hypothetical protein
MMSETLSPDNGERSGEQSYYPQFRLPELPEDVAIAGSKPGRQYLHRRGELVAKMKDLERNNQEMLHQLQDDYGALVLEEPPSRLPPRDHATLLLNRDPQAEAVMNACAALKGLPSLKDDPRSPQDLLRDHLRDRRDRLSRRDTARRSEGAAMLDRQGAVMLRLPPGGPEVPKVLKAVRANRTRQTAGVWANQVFVSQQDWGWVPSVPAIPLPPRHPLPETPGTGFAGQNVRVAVLDTGIRSSHQWLIHAESRGEEDYEEIDEDGDLHPDIEAGHGTFIAGVILQHAPGATIVGRAVVDSHGFTDDVALATALGSLRDESIDIINISLGGPADPLHPAPNTRREIDALRAQNPRLSIVAAAGNRNRSDLFYPAAFTDVTAVGALDRSMRRAPFSNFGPWVDAWALGVDIESSYIRTDVITTFTSDPGGLEGAQWSGTSFAAPRVAGSMAAAMSPGALK